MLQITFKQLEEENIPVDIVEPFLLNLGYKKNNDKFNGIEKVIFCHIERFFDDEKELFILGYTNSELAKYLKSIDYCIIINDGRPCTQICINRKLFKKKYPRIFRELVEHYIDIQQKKFDKDIKRVMNMLEIE